MLSDKHMPKTPEDQERPPHVTAREIEESAESPDGKSPAAVQLGRKGGEARAKKLKVHPGGGGANDIVVTSDIPLASRTVAAGAHVLGPTGRPFTPETIGMASVGRNVRVLPEELGATAQRLRPIFERLQKDDG